MIKKYESVNKNLEIALNDCLSQAMANKDEVFYADKIVTTGGIIKSEKHNVTLVTRQDVKIFIEDFLKEISKVLKEKVEYQIQYENESFKVNIDSSNNSILIGKNGKTMKSIQILLRQLIYSQTGIAIKINIDIANYSEKNLKRIEKVVRRECSQVLKTKIDVKLDSMNSFERKNVHDIVSEYENLYSESIGQEPNRAVVIKLLEK